MRAVKSRDIAPEIAVRKLLLRLGYRFRLHRKDLPGSPDLVLPQWRSVIFVHGCFWHGHTCKRGARVPKSNRPYWIAKIDRNRRRDRASVRQLRKQGWRVLIVWECQVGKPNLETRLSAFLATSAK